ncbi:hypothetical protein Hdeb2414_s0025g00669061 [Helianthus debilis subsp. tardiflorus]
MKFYLMNLLVLLVFLTYKAQGIRLGKLALSSTNHQDIFKISLVKGRIEDDQLLAKSAQFSSGATIKNRILSCRVATRKSPLVIEPGVSLEAASLFLRGRGEAVYILPSSDPTFALLLVGFTEYDDDYDIIWSMTPLT